MLPSLNSNKPEARTLLNNWVERFNVPDKVYLRMYSNIGHASTELIKGLAGLFPHKKKVLVIQGGQSILETAMSYLSGEAYELEIIHWKEWDDKKEELLKIDFCFAILAEDHLLTGEVYPYKDFLAEWNKARKFSISISSRNHFYDTQLLEEKDGFRARVLNFGGSCFVNVLGSRMRKLPELVLGDMPLSDLCIEQSSKWESLISEVSEDLPAWTHDRVTEFSYQWDTPVKDRLVFRIKDVDSFSLKQLMIREWGEEISNDVLTGSLCEWGGIRRHRWMELENQEEVIAISKDLYKKKKAELSPLLDKILQMMG